MADYQCVTVSKPFRVKRPDTFERVLRKHHLKPEPDLSGGLVFSRKDDEFSIYGYTSLTVLDPETEEPVFLPDLVKDFIADGSIAVFKETGHTKCRFDEATGIAVVVSDKWVLTFTLENWIEGIIKNLIDEHGHGR